MKTLLIIVVFAVAVGLRSERLHWRELGLLALFVSAITFWETFNILFRYIGVE